MTTTLRYDVAIIGSGAGGGTVAQALVPLVQAGKRVLVLERGPRFRDHEFTGRELEMAPLLYADNGGFLTDDGTMTLAFARCYGGSTVVYTGTSLTAPERVIRAWGVPGLDHADLVARSRRYLGENNVHLLGPEELNENNRLFALGARKAGYAVEQFPVNVKGCLGSSLCNLGCPNQAKQGTNRVQLPAAERGGVEVVTRAEVLRVDPDRSLTVRVSAAADAIGHPSEWAPGDYRVETNIVIGAAGTLGTSPLLLRSPLALPHSLGRGFTCHPALIIVALHAQPITNDVGHPKSFYVDRGAEEGFFLETCMYFPFTTAKALAGFGPLHSEVMRAYPRQQQILLLSTDTADDDNRIGVDRDGGPVVHYRFAPDVVEKLVRGNRAAARICFAAGATHVHVPFADPPLLAAREAGRLDELVTARHWKPGKQSIASAHLMGGCRMGHSAADSVTDSWGRVHGMPWLRVADASLFPDALEINPYLTIMALADRVAEGVRVDVAALAG
ncbi:MAG TPA: GMC oxidoreductase [Gemmatimonadales bacterium]|nr:GMC oxidoreductase [Gemmatimonadales bacterium]